MSSNNNFKETFLTKKGEDVTFGEDSTDTMVVNSNAEFNSQTTFNSQINMGGPIIPTINDQFDIGSAEYKVRDLYLSSNSLHIGGTILSEDTETDGQGNITERNIKIKTGENEFKLAKLDAQGKLPNNKMPEGLLDNDGNINKNKIDPTLTLNDLTGVDTSGVADGNALVYSDDTWKPGTVASGGGSGIVNNRIDGDLTIGEDTSEMLTIASKLHIPGGESGQVLTKGTDGSIEYGPTSFPSVTLPDGGGVIKEKIARYCNGDTISTKQGNMTLQNVTTMQSLTSTSYTDINGSEINYHPPTGTTCVIYEFECYYTRQSSGHDDAPIGHFKFYIDDVEQVNSRITIGSIKKEGNISLKALINISGTTDSNSLTLNSWTSIKNLHWKGREYNGDHEVDLHRIKHWDGQDSNVNIIKPSIIITAIKEGATTFTTANPLLANPSTADKGKIVTVNGTGDALEYGANFRELACNQTIIQDYINITNVNLDQDAWVDLASHNTLDNINVSMNTETKVNVSQNSKVEIKVQIGFGHSTSNNDAMAFAIRLGKKIDGNIIWGNNAGWVAQNTVSDNALTDPKGNDPNNNNLSAWDVFNYRSQVNIDSQYDIVTLNPSYIDEDPTNGLSGYHDVTYFIRVLKIYVGDDFFIGKTGGNDGADRSRVPTIMSVTEIGSGAITSFTQEQALAGGGGTAAFTNAVSGFDTTGSPSYGTKDNLVDNKLYSDSSNATLYNAQLCPLLKGGNAYWFYSVTFTTPQIVTKYRIWGRGDGSASSQNPRDWEFRATTDSSTYNATDSKTYTVLDSQVSATFNSYTSTANASDNLSLGNVYNLSTIGAYKYYVLHITASGNNAGTANITHCTMAEIALYGGGFTIPSQIGHSGKTLKTNGTALEWSAPLTGLLPPPVAENKGKIVTVNAAGDDLEYGANFRELACEQTLIRNVTLIDGDNNNDINDDQWIDLASHNTIDNISTEMNTEVTVNVSQNSKIRIDALISFGQTGTNGANGNNFAIRLGKKVDGNIIWGHTSGNVDISDPTDEALTDPKGNDIDAGIPAWSSISSHDDGQMLTRIFTLTPHYIDIDPTNGQSGTHNVTYFIRVVHLYQDSNFYIGRTDAISNGNTRHPTILSATEIGSGAITSFTQEQALAGAGGTAAFTASGTPTSNDALLASLAALAGAGGTETFTVHHTALNSNYGTSSDLHDDSLAPDGNATTFYHYYSPNPGKATVGYEFTKHQKVDGFAIYPRYDAANYEDQNPKDFDLKAANSKTDYDNGVGVETLLSVTNATWNQNWNSTLTASENVSKANYYSIPNNKQGSYGYYELVINTTHTGLGQNKYATMTEFALYGEKPGVAKLHDNSTSDTGVYYSVGFNNVASTEIAYEFNTPQIITKYRMWPHTGINTPSALHASSRKQNPKAWELRAATDSATYDSGNGTFTVLDSQSLAGDDTEAGAKIGWKIDSLYTAQASGTLASNLTHLANEYTLSTIGAYKYYVLHFTENYGGDHIALSEWALYGGGFTIPSQVGHSGKILKTNGTSLKWEAPVDALLPAPQPADKGKIITVNSTGDDLEYSAVAVTQKEVPLAGAGGAAAFNVYASTVYTNQFNTGYLHDDTYTNSYASSVNTFSNGTGYAFVAYEFTVPQIVTKYILWPRYVDQDENQNARIWELRAADSQQEYDNGNFTTLDSQSLPGDIDETGANQGWPATANGAAPNTTKPSNSMYFGNQYNLSQIGAYKYYRLNITGNYGSSIVGIQEWALYGEADSVNLNGVALTANPSADYNVVLPQTIGSAGQSLKISSIAGNTAFCHWN